MMYKRKTMKLHSAKKTMKAWVRPGFLFVALLAACQSATPEVVMPTAMAQAGPTRTAGAVETSEPIPTVWPTLGPRDKVTSYRVGEGDTLSEIAAHFGLKPETVLWANTEQLFDNADFLLTGMVLVILPVDGVYHQVGGGDTLNNVAAFFGADAQRIADWEENGIDPQNPVLFAGQWIVVPGGTRFSRWRQMPDIGREASALDAGEFGSGACGANYPGGPVGDGELAWPVKEREVLGERFTDWHPGVDLAVSRGDSVRAVDDGVVTFAGWSNLGYGLMVMVDHGNGDFSLYGGLGEVVATCGRGVAEGDALGTAGLTGYPAGAILHFELRRGGQAVDPMSVLSATE
ncbi:MAG: peptidoglycan DD-metalloendopeptidase family protein [Chloroflexi bacterium]|nr:peptidoglycan DD-metalloendopeptidase family protein [Chloroflexota bacterium]